MSRPCWTFPLLGLLLLPAALSACLWDLDTLEMERSRFPSTLELISGKFLRHSPEFYNWRIQDRQAKLYLEPDNLAYYDDLAVAYDKTGQHDKAIETILKKEAKKPGLYETYANLGTFYIHSGQLEKGVEYIGKAMKINPDAHFGREEYQKYVVEYVLSRSKGGKPKLPLTRARSGSAEPADFYEFLAQRKDQTRLNEEELKAAVKGVLGMMKFGKHDAPVLLEVLGNLLGDRRSGNRLDAKLLAARAYLKASYEVTDEGERDAYRKMAAEVRVMQTRDNGYYDSIPLEEIEADFQKELADAHQWYADLRERELKWVRESADPEAAFAQLYREEPKVGSLIWENAVRRLYHPGPTELVACLIVAWLVSWLIRRRRAARAR
jgi:tetratricopeptide (TPR) repeat protein